MYLIRRIKPDSQGLFCLYRSVLFCIGFKSILHMDHSPKRVLEYYSVMDSNQYLILIIRITTHFFQFQSHLSLPISIILCWTQINTSYGSFTIARTSVLFCNGFKSIPHILIRRTSFYQPDLTNAFPL